MQLDPRGDRIDNARRAKKYLERYFSNSKIDIYWGTAADFLRELKVHLDTTIARRPAGKRRRIPSLSDDARPASPTQPVRWAQAF